MGIDGLISTPWITQPLPCTLQDTPFSHSFLILIKHPTLILGWDLLSKFKASITIPSPPSDLAWLLLLNPTFSSSGPLPTSSINPIVWDTNNPSVASHHAPIHIHFKDPSKFPNQPQYPISQKHQQGLKPIITKLLCQGLLHPTYSPYNTPTYLSKSQMAPIAWSRTWDLSMQLLPHTPNSSKSLFSSLSHPLFHYPLRCSGRQRRLLYYPFIPRLSRPLCRYLEWSRQSLLPTADMNSSPTRLSW